jgi:2-alkyl-3-oxoalkanoate reductase
VKILVTGASGMLGAAVARQLYERGDEVTAFQRKPADLSCAQHLGDVADLAEVRRAAAGHDAVVHLAARVSVTGRWGDFARTNVTGTANVLDAARAAGAGQVVHVSSPSVAHAGESLVAATAAPADPDLASGHYARSKAVAERLALAAPGLAVVAVRPHLVWGPGDTQLVGRIVQRARAGRLALVGPGSALVDTTYVDNAADAIVAALDRADDPAVRGRAFVVSNGQPRPLAELVQSICAAAGVEAPHRHVPYWLARAGGGVAEVAWAGLRRTDDPPMTRFLAEQLATAHWFDLRETKQALRWFPVVDLDEGFRRLAQSLAGAAEPAERTAG